MVPPCPSLEYENVEDKDCSKEKNDFGLEDLASASRKREPEPAVPTATLATEISQAAEAPRMCNAGPEAERLHAQGYEARKKGDYKTAILCYTQAIERSEGYFKAYFNRGFAYDKVGEYEKAIHDYSRALELEPKNAFVYYNRGISLDKMQRYDEAIYNFSMAITLDPSKADFYHNRGFAFRKKLEYEAAIQDYSKALDLNPNHFKARVPF